MEYGYCGGLERSHPWPMCVFLRLVIYCLSFNLFTKAETTTHIFIYGRTNLYKKPQYFGGSAERSARASFMSQSIQKTDTRTVYATTQLPARIALTGVVEWEQLQQQNTLRTIQNFSHLGGRNCQINFRDLKWLYFDQNVPKIFAIIKRCFEAQQLIARQFFIFIYCRTINYEIVMIFDLYSDGNFKKIHIKGTTICAILRQMAR